MTRNQSNGVNEGRTAISDRRGSDLPSRHAG